MSNLPLQNSKTHSPTHFLKNSGFATRLKALSRLAPSNGRGVRQVNLSRVQGVMNDSRRLVLTLLPVWYGAQDLSPSGRSSVVERCHSIRYLDISPAQSHVKHFQDLHWPLATLPGKLNGLISQRRSFLIEYPQLGLTVLAWLPIDLDSPP